MNGLVFADYLHKYHKGIENAVHAKTIGKAFDMTPRQIRFMVNALRQQGMPICSGQAGYWWAGNEVELVSTIKTLQSQVNALEDAIKGMVGGYNELS